MMIGRWAMLRRGLLLAVCAAMLPAHASAEPDPALQVTNVDAKVDALLAKMSLPHKVAQLIQPDISTITPEDVRRYRFGSVLNGGNSGPGGNDHAPPRDWLKLADALWTASAAPLPDGEPAIPLIWGTDAVHGHNNIPGATLFPHNIALGAANDPALTRKIGEATAAEIAVTGIDWAFAPTIAVARDARWGRTYESYSESPDRVAPLGTAMVEGLQGVRSTPQFLDQRHVLATIKHFFGDGGTGGIDRGDTTGSLDQIERVHAAAYPPAIAAGAQTVMASFNSINGQKMHGNHALLTGLLRDTMHFDGLVVGDWNGHGLVPGCTNADCPQAINAGLDVFMVPEDWRALYDNTLREAQNGTIPLARIDEAVRRILRVKLRYGILDKPMPSLRALAGHWDQLGSPEHRALAREAVAKSLVLLKNNGVLPLRAGAHVVVAGSAADSVARQSGGWTITWQGGDDLTPADLAGATSIRTGLAQVLTLDTAHPDAAIVVFGETPYAEYAGDRPDHALHDEEGLRLLEQYHAAHIPTVAVLLSGRPLWTPREMALADAFVAAWLPGSEGEGVADVLVGDITGRYHTQFNGTLSFHWPSTCRDDSAPLLPVGYGGRYGQPVTLPPLTLTCAAPPRSDSTVLFRRVLGEGVQVSVQDNPAAPPQALPAFLGNDGAGVVSVSTFDARAQEDGRRIAWHRPGSMRFTLPQPVVAKGHDLVIEWISDGSTGPVTIAGVPLPAKGPLRLPMQCVGESVRLDAAAPAVLRLVSLAIEPAKTNETQSCEERKQ